MFRSRRRAEISEAVAESTARLEQLLQSQLDVLARAQATIVESVAATDREIERREHDLVEVLGLVSELCRHAIDVVEADRAEHRAFLTSLAEVIRPALAASSPAVALPTETILGGTVFAAPGDVDLRGMDHRERLGIDVR